jgi:hypothetical protein
MLMFFIFKIISDDKLKINNEKYSFDFNICSNVLDIISLF